MHILLCWIADVLRRGNSELLAEGTATNYTSRSALAGGSTLRKLTESQLWGDNYCFHCNLTIIMGEL